MYTAWQAIDAIGTRQLREKWPKGFTNERPLPDDPEAAQAEVAAGTKRGARIEALGGPGTEAYKTQQVRLAREVRAREALLYELKMGKVIAYEATGEKGWTRISFRRWEEERGLVDGVFMEAARQCEGGTEEPRFAIDKQQLDLRLPDIPEATVGEVSPPAHARERGRPSRNYEWMRRRLDQLVAQRQVVPGAPRWRAEAARILAGEYLEQFGESVNWETVRDRLRETFAQIEVDRKG